MIPSPNLADNHHSPETLLLQKNMIILNDDKQKMPNMLIQTNISGQGTNYQRRELYS